MDKFIALLETRRDGDLMLCEKHGIAYQSDMTAGRVAYDSAYLAKFEAYDPQIAAAVNTGRCAMLARHLPKGASVLDVGAGDGAFVRAAGMAGFDAYGMDPIPKAAEALRNAGVYADDPSQFDAVTLWDTIEHLDNPGSILWHVDSFLFVSLPVFDDFSEIRASKHYRPGEHLFYFTIDGFISWAALYGFRLLERSAHEVEAGRESVGAFAFVRI